VKADIPPLVLLVDDYEDSRYIYVHALTTAGYRVAEAEDGQQGLDKAFETRPDLIVMDLSLPVLDGWEAIRRLRRDERTRHLPIVALTGHADLEGEDNPGFDSLLVKPCSPDALIERVRTLLADKRPPPAPSP
jgi:two-component system cell cycle response regulator DivK